MKGGCIKTRHLKKNLAKISLDLPSVGANNQFQTPSGRALLAPRRCFYCIFLFALFNNGQMEGAAFNNDFIFKVARGELARQVGGRKVCRPQWNVNGKVHFYFYFF